MDVKLVAIEIGERIEDLSTEDVKLRLKSGKVDRANGVGTLTIEISVPVDGKILTADEANFRRLAEHYGLKAEDLGKVFEHDGNTYTICALYPRARKFKIGARNGHGTVYSFTPYQVSIALKRGVAQSGWRA